MDVIEVYYYIFPKQFHVLAFNKSVYDAIYMITEITQHIQYKHNSKSNVTKQGQSSEIFRCHNR